MSEYLRQQTRKAIQRIRRLPEREMVLGKVDGTVRVVIDGQTQEGVVWVHDPNATDASRSEESVYATNVAYKAGLVVRVVNKGGRYPVIAGINEEQAVIRYGDAVGAMVMPPIPPDVWEQPIPSKAIRPLRARVSGLEVTISPGIYRWNGITIAFAGDSVDLSTTQAGMTASRQLMVVIYLDTVNRTLGTTTTIERLLTANVNLLLSDARALTLTLLTNQFPIAYIRLNDTQTALSLQTDVYDARAFLTVGGNQITTPEATELTIASGEITVTQSLHTVDTESDASSDDLDTINGLVAGTLYVLSPANAARTVVIKDGTGNIETWDGNDITLDEIEKWVWVYAIDASTAYAMAPGAVGGSSPPFDDDTAILQDNSDNTKQLRFELAGFTTGNTRVITPLDEDGTLVYEDSTQTLTNKTLTTPTVGDFTNATHNHENTAGGGTLSAAAIASGTLDVARIPNLPASQITSGTFDQARLATDSVGSAQIQAGAVGSSELASTGVSAATYTAATITVDVDGRITSASSNADPDTKVGDLGTVSDNRLVRTNGTTGLSLQQSGITVDDSDNVSGVEELETSQVEIINTGAEAVLFMTGTTGTGSAFGSATASELFGIATVSGFVRTTRYLVDATNIRSAATNTRDLGSSSIRWRDIYLVNSPNVSSTREGKDGIEDVPKRRIFNFMMQLRPRRYRRRVQVPAQYGVDADGNQVEVEAAQDYIRREWEIGLVHDEVDAIADDEASTPEERFARHFISDNGVYYDRIGVGALIALQHFVVEYEADKAQTTEQLQQARQRIRDLEDRVDALEALIRNRLGG